MNLELWTKEITGRVVALDREVLRLRREVRRQRARALMWRNRVQAPQRNRSNAEKQADEQRKRNASSKTRDSRGRWLPQRDSDP